MTAHWDTSRTDWKDRIMAGQSLMPDLPPLSAHGDRAVAVFDLLRLPDVPGKPPLSEAGGDWFRDVVRAMFGAWDGQSRHIREAFLLVPKKSSKTTYSAAMMLTALIIGHRPRAEYLLVAPTQQIAELAFNQAAGMVEADAVLSSRSRIQWHLKTITWLPSGAALRVKSFDPKVLTGTRASGILLDEMHVTAESASADRVIGQLRGGLVSQPEGFLVSITTQSERPPAGVFRAELHKARKVRDGLLHAPILPILYELPDSVDWRDVTQWHLVTPNNGLSVQVERLIDDYRQAEAAGEPELKRWASQHLNVEVGIALAHDHWAGAAYWEQCGVTEWATLDDLLDRSEVVAIGIDGGGLDDLLALAVVGRDTQTGHWLCWCYAWAHEAVLERRKSEAQRLHDYAADGHLTIVRRIGDDVLELAEMCHRVYDSGRLDTIGCDPHGLGSIVEAITDTGVPQDAIIGVSQGWKMGAAIQTLERKLAESSIEHPNQPLMAWAVANARIEARANSIMITKQSSGRAKIDPLMALLDAVTLMALNPQSKGNIQQFISAPLIL